MSGPKVINLEAIRRRRQRESLAQLRQLQDLMSAWQSETERAGLFTNELATEAAAMLGRLEAMRQREDWTGLLAELPARREFFRVNLANAREAGIKRLAASRDRGRRLALAAGALQREWRAAGQTPPPELDELTHLPATTDETALAQLEAALERAFRGLPQPAADPAPASPELRELARALRAAGAGPQTLHEWITARTGEDPVLRATSARLDRALAELELHAPAELSAPFLARARLIPAEPDPDQRALLIDSLLLAADELCRSVREREETTRLLREQLAALEPFSSAEAKAWRQRLTAALENPSPVAAREVAAAAQAWAQAEAAREEAGLGRASVLKALAELGYEVREGMATAWAEQGRLVVRKPADPNYGVELASPATGAAVQARVVAFDVPGRSALSAQRDREVEHTWCGEFQRMRQLLEADGFAPALQHAIPAGEVPVKVVPQPKDEVRSQSAEVQNKFERRSI